MSTNRLFLSALAAFLPISAAAAEQGFFAGFEVLGGTTRGSSSTTNGGGVLPMFEGDGVVRSVRFGGTHGVGGHVGYRFSQSWSAFLSYQYIRSRVDWDADYPLYGASSHFNGKATSHAIMGNLAYHHALSEATSLRLRAGIGVTSNVLSGVVETDNLSGQFVSNVAGHRALRPTAQLGVGIQHRLTPTVAVGLDFSASYAGKFETGNTRFGNLGITNINPYVLDSVWRRQLSASLSIDF